MLRDIRRNWVAMFLMLISIIVLTSSYACQKKDANSTSWSSERRTEYKERQRVMFLESLVYAKDKNGICYVFSDGNGARFHIIPCERIKDENRI